MEVLTLAKLYSDGPHSHSLPFLFAERLTTICRSPLRQAKKAEARLTAWTKLRNRHSSPQS